MKFEIKLNVIKDYLRRLSTSVQSVSSRVEFTGILINVWDNSITFEGRNDWMDTKIEITSLTDVKIIETGRALLKANMLNEIVQRMTGELITFTKVDSHILVIEGTDSKYEINLLNDENYERASFINETDESVKVPSNIFKDGISKTAFAGNEYHTKFIYQGAHFFIDEGVFTMTVVDGKRVASYSSSLNSDKRLSKIIPLKVVKELLKILPSVSEYKLYFTNNKGVLVSDNMINQFMLIEGTFPIFKKFFSVDMYDKKLLINRQVLQNSIDRTTILSAGRVDSSRIGFKISSESIVLESREQEVGSAKLELTNYDYSGDAIEISLSPKMILDAIRNYDVEDLEIYFTESKGSVLIKSKKDNLIYLMSPMA